MPVFPLQLPAGSELGRDGQAAASRIINGYVEQTSDGKSSYAIYAAPGLKLWSSGALSGNERGLIVRSKNELIGVIGTQVAIFDLDGAPTIIGTIPGTGRCVLSRNRKTTPQVTIVTASGSVYIAEGSSVTLVTDPDLPAPNSCAYVGSRTIYGIQDGRIFASAINDSGNISAAAFDTADSKAGSLVRVFESSGYLYVFLSNNIEIWQADASLASQPFPFSPVQQNINVGLLAKHSVAEIDSALIWVDDDGIVRQGRDASAQRVSNHYVERLISELDDDDRSDLIGSTSTFHGHKVYTLTSADWTLQYDALIGKWYERKTYGRQRWRGNYSLQYGRRYIYSTDDDPKLYELDIDTYKDGALPQVLEVWCPHLHRYPAHLTVDALKLDVIGGVGLQTGDLADTDPHLAIDYSDDGGKTFQGEELVPIGQIGEYGTTIETYRWGLVEEKGRIWRFRASPAVLRGILQAYVVADEARV